MVSKKNSLRVTEPEKWLVTIKVYDLAWLKRAFSSSDKGREMAEMELEIDGSCSFT